jgi:hypothetical protein
MADFAKEMIEFAEKNPFDFDEVKSHLQEVEGKADVSQHGSMVRIQGSKTIEFFDKYNRFIFLEMPIQVTYFKYENTAVQLMMVSNTKVALPQDTIMWVAQFFIDFNRSYSKPDTPPHVAVLLQELEI